MKEKKLKVLTTAGLPQREVVPGTGGGGGSLSVHQLVDGKLKLTAREYVNRYGTDEDFKRVREVIADRRKLIPAFSYWRCECGWTAKLSGELQGPVNCLKCNWQRLEDSRGWMVRMTEKEAAQFEVNAKAKFDRDVAKLKEMNKAHAEARNKGLAEY